MNGHRGRRLGAGLVGVLTGLWLASAGEPLAARAADEGLGSGRWSELRSRLFGDRPIQEDSGGVIRLDVPSRPDHAAAVPVVVRATFPQSRERSIKTLFVIVDNNPDPLVGIFHLTLESGLADLATNIRIQEQGPVRAIAETSNGELYMSSREVKAAGGCAGASQQGATDAVPALGEVRIRVENESVRHRPNWAQVLVRHPNHTGLQLDPTTGQSIAADFIKTITVRFNDRPVLVAKTGISISEDPTLRFYYLPREPGTLTADVTDSKGRTVRSALPISPR